MAVSHLTEALAPLHEELALAPVRRRGDWIIRVVFGRCRASGHVLHSCVRRVLSPVMSLRTGGDSCSEGARVGIADGAAAA